MFLAADSETSFSRTVGHRWRSSTLNQPSVKLSLTVNCEVDACRTSHRARWLASATFCRRRCTCGPVQCKVVGEPNGKRVSRALCALH